MSELTVKQRRFVEEYTGPSRFNATEAARRAGYSNKTASEIGYENLRKPQIKKAIAAHLDELSMSAEEATKRLTDWGRGDMSPFTRITATGEVVVDLSTAEAQANLHLIRKLEVSELRAGDDLVTAKTKIELHDAKDATIQMAKIRGKYVERFEGRLEVGGVLRVPEVNPGQWRAAAAGKRVPAGAMNGNGNGKR